MRLLRRLTGKPCLFGALLGALLAVAVPRPGTAQQAEPHHEPAAPAAPAAARPAEATPVTNRARYQIPAVRVGESPVIDGVLDDATWSQAALVDAFVQQEPTEGAPATERTEVRVMYDGATLLVGVRAFDSAADGVVATEMRRDGNRLLEEDNFQIILDTFMDSRSAYMFVVSPLGAMLDQQIFEEGAGARGGSGGNINRDWDGVWHAAAQRTADGWTAEMAIPMVTLRFPDAAVQSWGLNFQRTIARKSESVFWAPIPREYTLTRVSLAGALTDLESLDRGRDLRIKPYALAGGRSEVDRGVSDRSTNQDVGLDVKYGITPGLNLDLTVNTDFAQAEADDERVNLTRFALLFPEKRDFFLENAGQFNVGAAGGLNARVADLFFSRRIGILETGAQAPILGGARLTGKLGQNNIAVMDIQTDDAFGQPGQNFLVARYSRDFLQRSRIGALAINKEGGVDGHYNRTFASDLIFAPNPRLTFNAFLAKTATPGTGDDDLGWYVRGAWLGESLNTWVEHADLGNDFNAEVGFVPRVGIRRSQLFIQPSPRPDVLGLRVLEPMFILTYTADQAGRMVSRQRHYMMGFRFDNGAFLNFWHNQYFERLDDPFNVASGIPKPSTTATARISRSAPKSASRRRSPPPAASPATTWTFRPARSWPTSASSSWTRRCRPASRSGR